MNDNGFKDTLRKYGWMGVTYCVDCDTFTGAKAQHPKCVVVEIKEIGN